jgi:predicted nucleic acid-binding protein
MTARFADTFYFLALLNPADKARLWALDRAKELGSRLLTTDWVIVEVADAFAKPAHRPAFLALWDEIREDPAIEIVATNRALLLRGIDLYSKRPDKAWSLTDCISFVVMTEHRLVEALTGDNHFVQAGFEALFRSG